MNLFKKKEELNKIIDLIRASELKNDDTNTLKYILEFFKIVKSLPVEIAHSVKKDVHYYHSLKRISEIYRKQNNNFFVLSRYLIEIINNVNFASESNSDKYNFYLGVIFANINLAISTFQEKRTLSFNEIKFISIAEGYLQLLDNFDKNSLEKDLLKLYKKYNKFILGLKNNNYYVEANVALPFPIYISSDKKITFDIDNIHYSLIFNLHKSPRSRIYSQNCYSQVTDDKYGLENITTVKIVIHNLLPVEQILNKSIAAINHFINEYRIISNLHWTDEINIKMLNDFNFDILIGDESFFECLSQMPNNICISNSPFYLSEEKFNLLEEKLNYAPSPIWLTLYSDSINFLSMFRFKESILSLNISLESFINLEILPIIEATLGKHQYNIFITSTDYNDSVFKDFLSEDIFNNLVSKQIISDFPSVSKILKKGIDLSLNKEKISKSKLTSIIKDIRKFRNDITHGRNIPLNSLESQSVIAINSFKKLLNVFGFSIEK